MPFVYCLFFIFHWLSIFTTKIQSTIIIIITFCSTFVLYAACVKYCDCKYNKTSTTTTAVAIPTKEQSQQRRLLGKWNTNEHTDKSNKHWMREQTRQICDLIRSQALARRIIICLQVDGKLHFFTRASLEACIIFD